MNELLKAVGIVAVAVSLSTAAALFVVAERPAAAPQRPVPDYCPEPPPHRSGLEAIRQNDGQHYFVFRDGCLVGCWRWRTREYFPRNPYGPGGWGGPTRPPSDFTPPSGDVGEVPPK